MPSPSGDANSRMHQEAVFADKRMQQLNSLVTILDGHFRTAADDQAAGASHPQILSLASQIQDIASELYKRNLQDYQSMLDSDPELAALLNRTRDAEDEFLRQAALLSVYVRKLISDAAKPVASLRPQPFVFRYGKTLTDTWSDFRDAWCELLAEFRARGGVHPAEQTAFEETPVDSLRSL